MKKVLLTIMMVMMAVSMFAAKATPAQVQEWQKKVDTTTDPWQKTYNQIRIDVLGKDDPKSYKEVQAKSSAAASKYYQNKVGLDSLAKDLSFQVICWNYPELVVETYNEVKESGSIWLFYYTQKHGKLLKLTNEDMFDNYYFVLMQFHNKPNRVIVLKNCVKNFLDAAAEVDEVKVKKALKVLNRKYSPKLLEDKAKWEPVVAMIRTALETY